MFDILFLNYNKFRIKFTKENLKPNVIIIYVEYFIIKINY